MLNIIKALSNHGITHIDQQGQIVYLLFLAGNFQETQLRKDLKNAGYSESEINHLCSSLNSLLSKDPALLEPQDVIELFSNTFNNNDATEEQLNHADNWLTTIIQRSLNENTDWQATYHAQLELFTTSFNQPHKLPTHEKYEAILIAANSPDARSIMKARLKHYHQLEKDNTIVELGGGDLESYLKELHQKNKFYNAVPAYGHIFQQVANKIYIKYLIVCEKSLVNETNQLLGQIFENFNASAMSAEYIGVETMTASELLSNISQKFPRKKITSIENIPEESSKTQKETPTKYNNYGLGFAVTVTATATFAFFKNPEFFKQASGVVVETLKAFVKK